MSSSLIAIFCLVVFLGIQVESQYNSESVAVPYSPEQLENIIGKGVQSLNKIEESSETTPAPAQNQPGGGQNPSTPAPAQNQPSGSQNPHQTKPPCEDYLTTAICELDAFKACKDAKLEIPAGTNPPTNVTSVTIPEKVVKAICRKTCRECT
ncbi:hypothetical protein WR25_02808 [Diploscapter pachys]|uniref:ShKT domain-containing protein n=1 Tax=Diploscapter pachys TaxID=2018661 RepID=A0A2A2LYM7_9BILA|nr:hypothetical protein WR25_02808 [Diploscapter pachys]